MLSGATNVYYDEEDCLGFDVFVAELELIVGLKKDKKPDGVQLLELLQKLIPSIERASKPTLKQYQRRCESVLFDVLLKGICSAVRKLIYICLFKMYTLGDLLPMYSRVSSLQAFLNSKDGTARTTAEAIRVGALDCLAYLALHQGRFLASGALESITIAQKTASKSGTEPSVRSAALRLAAAVVEGLGASDRSAATAQLEAWKTFEKNVKDKSSEEVRAAALSIVFAICKAGGVVLWASGGWYFEEAVKTCIQCLDDATTVVRDAAAAALGELAACGRQSTAQEALAAEKKASRKAAMEKIVAGTMHAALLQPFCDAAVYGKREVCSALAQAWLGYLAALQSRHGLDGDGLVAAAVEVVTGLEVATRSFVEAKERGLLPPDQGLGSCLSGGEMPHAQACVIYVIRVGVVEQLTESYQRKLLDRLTLLAQSAIVTPVAVVALEGIGLLLEVLGEVSEDVGRSAEAAIRSKMAADCVAVRSQAAAALAALAAAQPALAAQLLSDCLESLEAASGRLLRAGTPMPSPGRSGSMLREASMLPGTPRATADTQVKDVMNAVHGASLAAAALLIATARLPLGVPSHLSISAYTIAKSCIQEPAADATPRAVQREAGYVLLGSLVMSMHPDALQERQQEVLDLLLVALGEAAQQELDEKLYTKPGAEADLAVAMWWRAAALQALTAYILGALGKGLVAGAAAQVRQLAAALSPLLQAVTTWPHLHDPARAKGGSGGWPAAAAAMLQLRLLEVYFFLPGPQVYSADHASIIKLCVRPLRSTSGAAATPEAAAIIAKSSLRQMLNSQDALLGPWLPGRDLYQDELQTFVGERGGPQQHPWEAGMAFTSGLLGSDSKDSGSIGDEMTAGPAGGQAAAVRVVRRFMPYPQPYSLAGSLLEIQLWLLGKMFAAVSPINQLQILEVMLAAVQQAKGLKRIERDHAARRHAACICAAAAVLAGLSPLVKKGARGGSEAGEKVGERVLALAWAVLEDNAADEALARAAVEMVAAAGCLGGDGFLQGLVRSLCAEVKDCVASNRDGERRAVLALALGCIHRQAGGMALQSMVGSTTEHLVLVASRPTGSAHLWALHALWQVANAAGPTFIPYVRSTLQLAQELVASPVETPQLQAASARLANAMVAVLGPELDLGSPLYQKCKSLTTPAEPHGGEADLAGAGMDATLAELENVLFAQQLILFSPHAVPPAKHIPSLEATLGSRRPALRRAAAATLRHLAERDAAAVLRSHIEESLFAALDGEIEAGIAAQLRGAIEALLAAGASDSPSRWVRVLGDVALAAPAASAAGDSGGAERSDAADDEDGEKPSTSRPPSPSPPAIPLSAASRALRAAAVTPRLRTRQLAAACLIKLFRVVLEDPRHAEPSMLQQGRPADDEALAMGAVVQEEDRGDWLIHHLQQLVDLGFKLATGQVEALKPTGVRLLASLVQSFGGVQDPLQPGSLLLEQYQAQLVSALRSALQPGSPPPLSTAGGSLATTFLESGLAAGDATVMRRLMGLLIAPVAEWGTLKYSEYAEWVGVRARVALLQAHAQCATLAVRAGPEDLCASLVTTAQAPYMDMLLVMWGSLLQDHAVLASQPASILSQYRSPLYGDSTPLVVAAVQPCYAAACPVVLEALTACLPPADVVCQSRVASGDSSDFSGQGAVQLARMRTRSSHDEWNDFTESITAAVTTAAATEAGAKLSGSSQAPRLKEKAWEMYRVLLDVALMVVTDNGGQLAALLQGPSDDEEVAAVSGKLNSSIKGLATAVGGSYLAASLPPAEFCLSVLEAVTALAVQVLSPMLAQIYKSRRPYTPQLATLTSSLSSLLKDFSTSMPEQYYTTQPLLANAAVEAVLSISSIAVPYHIRDSIPPSPQAHSSTSHSPEQGPAPTYVGLSPYTSSGSPQELAMLDQSLVSLLVAGQVLLKKSPPNAFHATASALLECGLRLLGTSAPGVQLSGSQRFLDGCIAFTLDRSRGNSGQSTNGQVRDSTLQLVAGVALAICDAAREAQIRLHPSLAGPEDVVSTPTRVLINGGSFKAVADQQTDIVTRLPTLLGAALSAASQLPADVEFGAAVQQQLVASLQQALGPSAPNSLRCKVLEAVRTHLQEAATAHPTRLAWAQTLCQALLPAAATLVHSAVSAGSPFPLTGDDLATAVDSLKCILLAATTLFAPLGETPQAAILEVLVPLLIEVATPLSGPTPALADMALKAVTALPSSSAAVAFRSVVANLPLELKQRLQAAVQQQAAAAAAHANAAAGGGSGGAGGFTQFPASKTAAPAKPSIQLKTTFALPH